MSPHRKVRDAAPKIEPSPASGRRPRRVDEQTTAHASPARDLQTSLAEQLETGPPDEPHRWPGAVRLAIIGGGSALTWAGVVILARAVMKL